MRDDDGGRRRATEGDGGRRRTTEDRQRRTTEDDGGRPTTEDDARRRRTREDDGGQGRTREDDGGRRRTTEDDGGLGGATEGHGGPWKTTDDHGGRRTTTGDDGRPYPMWLKTWLKSTRRLPNNCQSRAFRMRGSRTSPLSGPWRPGPRSSRPCPASWGTGAAASAVPCRPPNTAPPRPRPRNGDALPQGGARRRQPAHDAVRGHSLPSVVSR